MNKRMSAMQQSIKTSATQRQSTAKASTSDKRDYLDGPVKTIKKKKKKKSKRT